MKQAAPTHIDPAALYSLAGFRTASGFSRTRMWSLRNQGIKPKTIRVGKRVFIKGADAVRYIEAAAALTAAEKPAAPLES